MACRPFTRIDLAGRAAVYPSAMPHGSRNISIAEANSVPATAHLLLDDRSDGHDLRHPGRAFLF